MIRPFTNKDEDRRRDPQEVFRHIAERIEEHRATYWAACCGGDIDDYRGETYGWRSNRGGRGTFDDRPYETLEEVWNLQMLGVRLRSSPTAKAIINKMIAYTVGDGHKYRAALVEGGGGSEDELREAQSVIDDMMEHHCWQDVQEDWAHRYLEVGDVFVQWEPLDDDLIDFVHLDSSEIAPNRNASSREAERTKFGIRFEDGDIRKPESYVAHIGDDDQDPFTLRNIIHAKNISQRFPRGLPLLWQLYCPLMEIDELEYGATQVGLTYMEHTAVYEYERDVSANSIARIRDAVAGRRHEAKLEGKPNDAGAVHHARDHTVRMLNQAFQSDGFVGLIDSKARRVGTALCMPEFMVTGKSPAGSLGGSALVQQEHPLLRFTTRLARKFVKPQVHLFYLAIMVRNGQYDIVGGRPVLRPSHMEWLREFKKRIKIHAEIPIPETQERTQREQSIIAQVGAGLLDRPTAVTLLGNTTYERMLRNMVTDSEKQSELQEDGVINYTYSPEELLKRLQVYTAYRNDGIQREEAAERAGLDPTILPPEEPQVPPALEAMMNGEEQEDDESENSNDEAANSSENDGEEVES